MTFSPKPLDGQAVLVTRPRTTAETPLVDRLHNLGADVIVHPVIDIRPPESWENVDKAIQRLHEFGTLVLLSSAGVQHFFGRYRTEAGPNWFGGCKVAAIGESTAARIREYGEDVHFIPDQANSESMAERLSQPDVPGPILLMRANRGSDVIAKQLTHEAKAFEEVTVYESHDVETADQKTLEFLNDGKIDWVTITSSAIARSTVSLFGESLKYTKLASISRITSDAIRKTGYEPSVEAVEANFEGLVNAIVNG